MEIVAIGRSIKTSPRKVRLVADSIRNLPLQKALNTLELVHKVGAGALRDVLKSAISNAVNNVKQKEENLVVKSIEVFEGSAIPRFHFSTRGRVHPYKKRTSHIKVILEVKK